MDNLGTHQPAKRILFFAARIQPSHHVCKRAAESDIHHSYMGIVPKQQAERISMRTDDGNLFGFLAERQKTIIFKQDDRFMGSLQAVFFYFLSTVYIVQSLTSGIGIFK